MKRASRPKRLPRPDPNAPIVQTDTIFASRSVDATHKAFKKQLTLAERLGLVEPPPAPMSDEEFEQVKLIAQSRRFFEGKCPICLEGFTGSNMALLSCSHLVHLTCLMGFRRLAQEPHCPVCRAHYEFVEVTADAAFKGRCARRIQRAFRFYLLRCRLAREGSSKNVRRKFLLRRFQYASDRLTTAVERQNEQIDAALADIDRQLEIARAAFRGAPIGQPKVDWRQIRKIVSERGLGECAICLRDLPVGAEAIASVTSCAHVFHTPCVTSWFKYCMDDLREATCPVCRQHCDHRLLADC